MDHDDLRLYGRVLALLGLQMRLGWLLAFANVLLAAAQFAEPVFFGRIIDSLAQAQEQGSALSWSHILPLVAAWVGFGLFMIVCSALVALYAD
jgi:ATP-binding cassette, subfamily B, beta-glucan exporter